MMKASFPDRLPLRGWDWLGHYGLPIYFTAFSLLILSGILFLPAQQQNVSDPNDRGLIVLSIILLSIASIVLHRQRRVLTLVQLKTKNDAEGNFRVLLCLAKHEGWRVDVVEHNKHLRMHVPARWYEPCWGEMVSVLFDEERVALNSICDPTKPRPSLASFGRNARNIALVKGALCVI